MRVYLAGMVGGYKERERIFQRTHKRFLLPFYVQERHGMMTRLEIARENHMALNKVELFLDSGAFSAWKQGTPIDINAYIDFVKTHEKNIALYAVLDVIGDAKGTLKNQKIMEEAGLNPLPTFHFGEDFKYLHYYIDHGYEYIALGGLASMGAKSQMFDFLDQCFDIICDDDGIPKVKVHGFAVTSLKAMKRYPWYSVDSTTWLMTARMGSMIVPQRLPNGDWDFLETMPGKSTRKIGISCVSPSAKIPDLHFSTISKQWQAEALDWIEEHGLRMGVSRFKKVKPGYQLQKDEKWAGEPGVGDVETDHEFGDEQKKTKAADKQFVEIIEEPGLCNDYISRDVICAMYFKELEQHFPAWPWAWERPAMQGFKF